MLLDTRAAFVLHTQGYDSLSLVARDLVTSGAK